nr:LytTR family DNA-binding domain-containing protein [Rhizobium sullae]
MDHSFMQSTLRELRLFIRSPRFWGTFAVVILIFAVSGPYGTSERMTAGQRLGYWLVVQAAAWSIAILCSVIAEVVLRRHIASMFWRMMLGSVAAALPIGYALSLIDVIFDGTRHLMHSGLQRAFFAVPLCALFCLLTYMAMNERIKEVVATSGSTPRPPSILDRLKPQNRGELLRLSVQDHYTEIVTSLGRELVLLRFADALRETGGTAGLQVHRSHWIADAHVERLKRDNGKLLILTHDGFEIPVSRSYAAEVRRHFG